MKERLWICLWLPVLYLLYVANSLGYLLVFTIIFGIYEVLKRGPASIWRYIAVAQLLCLSALLAMTDKAIMFAVLVVVANDVFAYVGGKYLIFHKSLKTKIFPKTSPNKTYGGFAYGIIFGTLVGIGVAQYLKLPLAYCFISPLVCLLAVTGDFAESKFKRHYSIKDSGEGLFTGKLLYGHGGVYDRFDAIALTAPAVMIIEKLI